MTAIYELQQMMGSATTDAEAHAMAEILRERGVEAEELPDDEFFALIPEAVSRAGAA